MKRLPDLPAGALCLVPELSQAISTTGLAGGHLPEAESLHLLPGNVTTYDHPFLLKHGLFLGCPYCLPVSLRVLLS